MPFTPPSPDTLVEEPETKSAFVPPSPNSLVEEAPARHLDTLPQSTTKGGGRVPLASAAEMLADLGGAAEEQAALSTSKEGIMSAEDIPSGAGTTHPEITIPLSAAGKLAAGVGGYMTSPQGTKELALAATPAAPLVYVKWAKDMIEGGKQSVDNIIDTLKGMIGNQMNRAFAAGAGVSLPKQTDRQKEEDYQALAENAFNLAASALGVVGAAHGAVKSTGALIPKPKPEIQGPLATGAILKIPEGAMPPEKGQPNAEGIRSDTGQPAQPGQIVEGIKADSGSDLQQTPPGQSEPLGQGGTPPVVQPKEVAAAKAEAGIKTGAVESADEIPGTKKWRSQVAKKAKDAKAQLVSEIEAAIETAPSSKEMGDETAAKLTKVTISIPGDGDFTIANTKENLADILKRANAIKIGPQKNFRESKPASGIPPEVFVESSEPTHLVYRADGKGVKAKPVILDSEKASGLKTWLASDGKTYSVVEETSGRRIGDESETANGAIKNANEHLETLDDIPALIKSHIEKEGQVKSPTPINQEPTAESEQGQTSTKSDPFERARAGDESAFDDLDAQFREVYPEEVDFGHGRTDPNTVHTPQAFAALFDRAFAARDFDTILNAIKATSDVSIWKPYLRDLFKRQAKDPIAAEKAEWMRHVFAGTRPANAIPRPPPRSAAPRGQPPPVTPPPRPKAGTPPPPKAPTTPPVPPPTRIPVDPIPGGGGKSPFRIIEDFSKSIGKAIRVLRMKKNGLGVYRPGSTLTAERFAGDLDTAAHELAGHWTDDRYGIGKPWVAGRVRSPYDTELAKFWPFGSVTPRSSLRYRRAEGIAEYIRAYVVNPKQAKLDAPLFSAYFEKTLPPEALKAIQAFSDDVRRWAGENPTARAGLNIRMEPPSLTERLWNALKGKGFGFETNPIDKLRLWFDDPYHYAVKADKAIQALRGGAPKLPSQEFELTARLLATHDSRMSDQFENGLVPLRPGQKLNTKGQLEVERSLDPVTKQPMTMKWLLGVFDTSGGKERFNQDMRDASAYMVAQRTAEKAKQLGREENVSGIGAGIMSDTQAAKELLAEVAKDPAKETRLQEAARHYRLWADQNINMLVDAGRITRGQARAIRESNQQYVDMHRLSEEFDVANYAQRGGGIGTTKDVIKRFKGSSLELDNVYSNLLEQTDSIQKEAHRNVVMNNFTDGLRNVRELHGPDLKDFDQFGRKVTSADKNTITIYKNGRAEHWQFAPPIHESLKGLGELQTNALFTIAMLPSKFARYMITRGPSFMIRNPLRDTTERSVNSRSGSKPWDIFQGYSKEELSRYEVFGGGQFGNYIVDQHVWNREIKKVMRDLVKDPANILLSPLKLKHAWEALGEKSEKIGRIAEFRRAFEAGKKRLAIEHPGLTPEELDYNAALYAAGEARGLLDFAKAGTVMRYINQAIPFSNASMRGLGKSIQGMKDNLGRYAMNWGLYVLAPTLAVMMWNRRDDETWKEYQQLPAYRRDFFWNLKVGDRWMIFPKPHLLGVLAGGVERIVSGILGAKHPMSGYGSGIGNALPVSNLAEASGPLKTFLELNLNRDTFRDRDIVPAWEKDLKLELRKGTKHASGAAQGIANALNTTGLGIDSRSVDHVLKSLGGWGNIATAVTTRNRTVGDVALQSTGLFTESPGTNAQDVQWVLDWARQNGKLQNPSIKGLTNLRKSFFEAKTTEEKQRISKALRDAGSALRNSIEKLDAGKTSPRR